MLFEHGLYLKILKTGHHMFTWCLLPRNRHFVTKFVDVNVQFYFRRMTSLFMAYQSMNSMVFQAFSRHFLWHFSMESYQNARIAITHVCFIELIFAGPSEYVWKNSHCGLIFKHLPLDPANVNAWKNMSDPYIRIRGKLYWKLSFGDVKSGFCCLKLFFKALLMCHHKTKFPTMKP